MDSYTQFMTAKMAEAINEDYPGEKLVEAVRNFRSFSESLDEFLKRHGYQGDILDQDQKITFLKNAFEKAGILPIPNFKKWYRNPQVRIGRETGFQICFALGIDKHDTEDFFKRVVLEKCFDCHIMKEAVYYYCFRQGLNYREAMKILEQAPLEEAAKASVSRMVFDEDTLYTSAIIQELDKCESVDDLLAFLCKNVKKFGYNHAGATRAIQRMWGKIVEKTEGLAAFEKVKVQKETAYAGKKRSVFDILNQILGLDEYEEFDVFADGETKTVKKPLFVIKSDRSLKPLLEDNPLLHQVAVQNFPNRLTIEKLLKGKLDVEPDSIRKLLIFVFFYHFWLGKAVANSRRGYSLIYQVRPGDDQRFTDELNKQLLDVQYPELYVGNPYDWIFLYCSKGDEPISIFREFVHEMYLVKEEIILDSNRKYEEKQDLKNESN